ncbi:MAG: hypothetical protein ACK41Z_10265 [Sediminibacterium sp.]
MRIEIHTVASTTPQKLWEKIKKDVKEEKIKTWVFVKDTNAVEYLTHTPAGSQWHKKALLKESFATNPSRLVLKVTWFSDSVPDEYTKGLYIGRFTEQLMQDYTKDFIKLETFA